MIFHIFVNLYLHNDIFKDKIEITINSDVVRLCQLFVDTKITEIDVWLEESIWIKNM